MMHPNEAASSHCKAKPPVMRHPGWATIVLLAISTASCSRPDAETEGAPDKEPAIGVLAEPLVIPHDGSLRIGTFNTWLLGSGVGPLQLPPSFMTCETWSTGCLQTAFVPPTIFCV